MKNIFPRNTSSPKYCRLLCLFSLLIFLAYSNSFSVSWQLDDTPNILTNSKQQLTEISFDKIWDVMTARPANPNAGELNRPISRLTLGFNWFVGGSNVIGYHIVNLLIHLGNTALLFFVIISIFATPRLIAHYSSGQITVIATIATLFWALNPVQVQAVTYIVQRMTSLAAFFSLLTLLCYIKSRLSESYRSRSIMLGAAGISYILAILSKENALVLPMLIPCLEMLFFRTSPIRQHLPTLFKQAGLALLLCILVVIALKPGILITNQTLSSYRPFTAWERCLTEQRIIIFYLTLLLFPHPVRLSVQHDIVLSTSLLSPFSTILAIIFNILLFSLALKTYRRHPLFSFAIIFFYINHVIESTFLPLELLFEHRNYLPSAFLFLPIAQLLVYLLEKYKEHTTKTVLLFSSITIILTSLAYATFTRNQDWQSVESLWVDAAKKAPHSARPLSSLALELGWGNDQNKTKIKKALQLQKHALTLQKNSTTIDSKIMGNIAALEVKLGNVKEAIDTYNKALEIDPNDFRLRYNFSKLLLWTGDFKLAKAQILTVLKSGFQHPDCWNLLAVINLWTGHPDQALIALQRALKMSPNRPDINLHLGKSLSMLGYHKRARLFFNQSKNNGGYNAFLVLCQIENSLRANDIPRAQQELQLAIRKFTIPYILKPLETPPPKKPYTTIPLDKEILSSFILSELPSLTNTLLQ